MGNQQNRDDTLYHLLKSGQVEEFNHQLGTAKGCNLSGKDLRGADLRSMVTEGVDLSHCHLRHADLRGLDLSGCSMEGASISEARISGTYFPPQLSAEEITLSLMHGTRMRYKAK